jgi:hypothetical protein
MRGVTMKKRFGITMLILGVILLCISAAMLFLRDKSGTNWSSQWCRNVYVDNGVVDKDGGVTEFTIEKAGTYNLELTWAEGIKEDMIGCITACVLTDERGKILFGYAAKKGIVDTDLKLEEGEYFLTFTYLTNKEDYVEFAKRFLCGYDAAEDWAEDLDFETLAKNSAIGMSFNMSMNRRGFSGNYMYGVVFAVLISAALVVLIIALCTEGRRLESPRYDERQELERGRGFKYGFFTLIIYFAFALCLDAGGVLPEMDNAVLYTAGIMVGIMVYVVYCIWHESYFALNEKKNVVMITFAGIAIVNLILGINSIASGEMVKNGALTFHATNILCAAMFVVLFATVLLKKISDSLKRRSAEDEEE